MQAGTWYLIPGKAPDAAFRQPTKHLTDLVKMSILAHREKVGNIIWACWQPGGAGAKIKDIRRVNSGAMLIMVTQDGADSMDAQLNKGPAGGGMRPWHFDLALKGWLQSAAASDKAGACYVFPPVGNYTTHISGCDVKSFGAGSGGRPNCWQEQWSCPGTTVDEDPQKRPKRFLRWNGDHNHFDVGSANVDFASAGHLEWRSFWTGDGPHPTQLPPEQRRPQKAVKKRPAGKGPAGVEPTATPSGAAGKTKGQSQRGGTLTTEGVLQKKGGRTGKGKPAPWTLWPDRPGAGQAPLDQDPIDEWDDNDDDDGQKVHTTKRQRRNIRGALMNRSFRRWVHNVSEAANIH